MQNSSELLQVRMTNRAPKPGISRTANWFQRWQRFDCTLATWDNPTMTLTADSKKRVVLPGAAPGDVFTCEQKGPEMVLRRVYRNDASEKTNESAGSQSDPQLESLNLR